MTHLTIPTTPPVSQPLPEPFDPEHFCGQVRLFPLPNLVMFPHALQLLHVYEPRYREMVAEALDTDGLIAMVLLKPGWEKDYDGRPEIYPVGCLGRITSCKHLPDGKYNLLLHGLTRVHFDLELAPGKLFREAKARLWPDQYPSEGDAQRDALRGRLLDGFRASIPNIPKLNEQLDNLLAQDVPLGVLTDIVGYTLDLEMRFKQQLLSEVDVDERCRRLLAKMLMDAGAAPPPPGNESRKFPPPFSEN